MVKRKDEGEKVRPRTKRAKRILEKREPKLVCTACAPRNARSISVLVHSQHGAQRFLRREQVEEVKIALLLHGNKTSQVTKVSSYADALLSIVV